MKKIKNPVLKFILLLVIGGAIGATSASFIFRLIGSTDINSLLDTILTTLVNHMIVFQLCVWIPMIIVIIFCYVKAYKLAHSSCFSEDDEEVVSKLLGISTTLSTLSMIFMFSTFSIAITQSIHTTKSAARIQIIIFMICYCISSAFEIANINLTQKLYSIKQCDPLDFGFEKQWIESRDEGEKMISYVAGFKTAMLMKKMFIFGFMLLIIIGMFVQIGALPFIILGVFWATFSLSYAIYSHQVSSGKLKY